MLARASVSVAQLDLADATVAADLHRIWQAAYTLEAQWLGERDFPPLRLGVAELRASGYRFLGARLHGQLLGALAIEDSRPTVPEPAAGSSTADVQVAALVVDPVHHGEGIGRELIAEFQRTVQADGAFAHTAVANAAARVAFGRMGFLWHHTFTVPASNAARGDLPMVELRWRRRRIGADAPSSIRRLRAGEHALHRALMLRALREDADAFEGDLGLLSVQPDAYWEAQTSALAGPGTDALLLAERGTRVCGCLILRQDPDDPHAAVLDGLWVDPALRRHGVGSALLAAAAASAADAGRSTLRAWLPEARAEANAFLVALGFAASGVVRPARRAGGQPAARLAFAKSLQSPVQPQAAQEDR